MPLKFRRTIGDHLLKIMNRYPTIKIYLNELLQIIDKQRTFENQKYEFIANASSEFMTLISREYRYEAANDSYCKAHGKPRWEILGKTVAEVWGQEIFNSTIKGYLDQCFEGNDVDYQEWFKFGALDQRCYQVRHNPYCDEHGTITHVAVVSTDITPLKQAEEQMKAALREKEVLLQEVHHRVKNNLQVISSLLDLTKMRTENPEANSLLLEAQGKIHTLALIHEQLYESDRFDQVDMKRHIEELTSFLFHIYGKRERPIVTPVLELSDVYLKVTQAIPCALLLNEAVSNSFKHAFKDSSHGRIEISLHKSSDDMASLRVKDDGVGIPEAIDAHQSSTLGFRLIRGLVQQLNGEIRLDREDGTTITIEFKVI